MDASRHTKCMMFYLYLTDTIVDKVISSSLHHVETTHLQREIDIQTGECAWYHLIETLKASVSEELLDSYSSPLSLQPSEEYPGNSRF